MRIDTRGTLSTTFNVQTFGSDGSCIALSTIAVWEFRTPNGTPLGNVTVRVLGKESSTRCLSNYAPAFTCSVDSNQVITFAGNWSPGSS